MAVLQAALEPSTVVVAVDPGKVMNRVWVSNGTGDPHQCRLSGHHRHGDDRAVLRRHP